MKLNFRIGNLPKAVVAGAAACTLFLTACGGPGGAAAGGELDLAALNLDSSQEQQLQDLYEAAIESGETDVAIYAGHHDEFKGIYEAFEERFPGLTITPETYVGAELQTKLDAERQSGNHVVDVLSNPNADRYADQGFADKYKPATFAMPEWAEGRLSLDQIEDPDGFYYAPWALMFASSYNTEKLQDSDLPSSWTDLADSKWAGKLTFMDPSIPGGTMTVLTTLLQAGIVDEAWLEKIGANAKVVAQDQLALQSISSGEFAYQPLSASISVLNAKQDGAPVEVQFFDKDNVIATEKWMLAADAPSSDAAKLLLSYLYTVEAQEKTLEAGNFPINQDESLTSPHGWPSLADAAFVELPEQSVMREKMTEYGELFKSVTAK
ncbi:extracellular solute-binding protein [Arthrobacter crystallopoietes]|uniref:ABC transporter substrate-binding protein n=1 Tax=Crystallibacter crystallopoietes TaxID=37928 RepID=UPI003D1B2A5E